MDDPTFICILNSEGGNVADEQDNVSSVCETYQRFREKPVTILTEKHEPEGSIRTMSVRRLFLQLYREHKLGGNKTMMFLSHDEHLVAVQLSIAEWNKQEKGTYEADIRSVLKASKAILAEKIKSCVKNGPGSPSRSALGGTSTLKTPRSQKSTLGVTLGKQTPRSSRISLSMASPKSPSLACTPRSTGISRLHELRDSPHTRMTPSSPHTPMTPSPGVHLISHSPNTPVISLSDDVVAALLDIYNGFVKRCGKVDVADVYLAVSEYLEASENERLLFLKENLFVIDRAPRHHCEREMLRYLLGDQPILCLSRSEVHIDGLHWERVTGKELWEARVPVSFLWQSRDLKEYLPCPSDSGVTSKLSVSERFIRKLFFSYISLLVNSADELALARCLCLPDAGLSHDGFTALKHVAQQKKMSMFLTAFSFVFELRRVKRASDTYESLFAHSKVLGEFVDVADKLLTITQDIPDVGLAAEKVLKVLKANFSKCKASVLRPTSVKKVYEEIMADVRRLTSHKMVNLDITPKPIGCGGSMRGQKVIKLFRAMIDIEATDIGQNQGFDELVDQESSQKTPVRLPSIISQFRSPTVQEQSLDPVDAENERNHKTPEVSYTKTHYGWVAPSMYDLEAIQHPRPSYQRYQGRTQNSPAPPGRTDRQRVPLEEITEETVDHNTAERNERVAEGDSATIDKTASKETVKERTTPSAVKVKRNKKVPLKRKKLELEAGGHAKKKPKKNSLPPQKGEKWRGVRDVTASKETVKEKTTPSAVKVKRNKKAPLKRKKLELEAGGHAKKKPKKNSLPPQKGEKWRGVRDVMVKEKTTPSAAKVKRNTKVPLLRKKLELETGGRAKKNPKKNNLPPQNGQRLLTNFFTKPKS